MKIKDDKIYKVEWVDICSNTNKVLSKPYNKHLENSYTIGYVRQSKDTVIVIYGGNTDENCFDAIPKSCVKSIKEI